MSAERPGITLARWSRRWWWKLRLQWEPGSFMLGVLTARSYGAGVPVLHVLVYVIPTLPLHLAISKPPREAFE